MYAYIYIYIHTHIYEYMTYADKAEVHPQLPAGNVQVKTLGKAAGFGYNTYS